MISDKLINIVINDTIIHYNINIINRISKVLYKSKF